MMTKFTALFSTALVVLLFAVSACKDDDVTAKTKTELLTTPKWFAVKGEVEYMGVVTEATELLIPNCHKDDYIVYNKDGTFQVFQGEVDCDDPEDNVGETGTWSFGADETTLVNPQNKGFIILQLDEQTFKYKLGGTVHYDLNQDGLSNEVVTPIYTLTAK